MNEAEPPSAGHDSVSRLRSLASAEEARRGMALVPRGEPGATEVLLVRHGQVEQSPGMQDVPLTSAGVEQAQALGEFLAAFPITAVYCSPYARCRQTAEAVAKPHGLKVIEDVDLRELESYLPEGKTVAELLGEDHLERLQAVRRWEARGQYSEHGEALRRRGMRAVKAAIEAHPGGRIVLATHGPLIAAVVAELMQSPYDFLFQPPATSVTVIAARDGKYDLRAVSSLAHLQSL